MSGTLALSIQTAAERLGVHRSTLYDMMRDGQLRTVKLRGRRLVPMAEVERILAGLEVERDPVMQPGGGPKPARVEKRKLIPRVAP